jgi:hypothetical protein
MRRAAAARPSRGITLRPTETQENINLKPRPWGVTDICASGKAAVKIRLHGPKPISSVRNPR